MNYFNITDEEDYHLCTESIQCNRILRRRGFLKFSRADKICKSDETCIAVQAYGCNNATTLPCYNNSGVPFRQITDRRRKCVYEIGNVKTIIYKRSKVCR